MYALVCALMYALLITINNIACIASHSINYSRIIFKYKFIYCDDDYGNYFTCCYAMT